MLAAIETTGATCGVALFDGKTLRSELHAEIPRAHDRLLARLFNELLEVADVKPADVQTYAVSIGPGSFTGIRIGLSFAIGASMASGADLVAVPTLDAVAFNVKALGQMGERSRVLALIPAGRDGLFSAIYEVRPGFNRLTDVKTVPPAHVRALVDESILLAGPGVLLVESDCLGHIIHESERLSARAIGRYGHHLYHNGCTTRPGDIRPLYISDFVPHPAKAG